jgi:transcriptional regulator with PAS, ATPase and Fis domain
MGVGKYGELFNMHIRECALDSTDEIETMVRKIAGEGRDVIIGGVRTCSYARELSVPHILLESGKESMWHGITEAKRLAYVSRRVEEQSENLKAILNKSYEGIIALDPEERVTVFNHAASQILSIAPGNALGKTLPQLLPALKNPRFSDSDDDLAPEIIHHNDKVLSVRRTAMTLRGESIGRIYALQEVSRIQELETRIREKIYVRGHVAKHTFEDIIGESACIHEVIRVAKKYSGVDSSILIFGKTGTGKELFAGSIHNYSPRKNGPFVAVNCAALSESLLESELFGYADGAFTGASKGGKLGLFELAHRGTLFLDEISEIPPRLQGRLLRAIQEKEIMRLGHDRVIPVDVRIISASNRNLLDLVKAGVFREDLYYRLDILKLELPDLARRRDDIPAIAEYWIERFCSQFKMERLSMTEKAKAMLKNTDLPGNIRQLRNICERLVVLSQGRVIDIRDVEVVVQPAASREDQVFRETGESDRSDSTFLSEMRAYERERVAGALKHSGYNKQKAAGILGISRTTLWRRMKELELV